MIKMLLWTGGWDSTYRIVELSRQKCTVQPYYVYGDNRISEKYEIKAMEKILYKLNEKNETKATILPIKFIDKKSIPLNSDITKAYELIANETNLGSQQEWLSRLAYQLPGLEIGTEAAPIEVSNILRAINKYGNLIKKLKGDGQVLDTIKSTKEGILVFGNLEFPIIEKTGQKMKNDIQLWGYEDVMKNVWVCHRPLFGKPCGICHPCELKIETNMGFILTESALKRYKKRNKQPFKLLYEIQRQISKSIHKLKQTLS